jgi:hypothetical protein
MCRGTFSPGQAHHKQNKETSSLIQINKPIQQTNLTTKKLGKQAPTTKTKQKQTPTELQAGESRVEHNLQQKPQKQQHPGVARINHILATKQQSKVLPAT